MMEDSDQLTFTEGEFYQENFDSREYLNFYKAVDGSFEYFPFELHNLNETFASDYFKGKKLIEIGCGPSIHGVISASKYFKEVVMSDFTDSNRRELEKWLRNEEGCFDWRPTIQYVCELEGRSRSPEEVEQRLRQIVKRVLKCDIRLENPFHPLTMEPADCVLSLQCLGAACKDLETYRCAIRNIATLLKPGGALIFSGSINGTFYSVGQVKFSSLTLSQSCLEEMVRDEGFSIKRLNILPSNESELKRLIFGRDAFFYLVAQKIK